MGSEKRKWHLHVVTAHRMTESQFTELQSVTSVEHEDRSQALAWLSHVVSKEFSRGFGGFTAPGSPTIIPEALHFNIEISNVEEGRSL